MYRLTWRSVIHSPGISLAPCDRRGARLTHPSRTGHLGCRQAANLAVVMHNIVRDNFHGEWNYTIKPRTSETKR
jgi:hypothetical protein